MGLVTPFRRGSTKASWTASYPSRSAFFTCATKHGPAFTTVTGTARVSWKIWVMPSFSPRIPFDCAMAVRRLPTA